MRLDPAFFALLAVTMAIAAVVTDGDARARAVIVAAISSSVVLAGIWRRHRYPTAATVNQGEYWWLGLLIPFGLATGVTFIYLGLRARRRAWTTWGFVYLGGMATAIALNLAGRDDNSVLSWIASGLLMAVWCVGGLHAYLIRNAVRTELAHRRGDDGDPPLPRPTSLDANAETVRALAHSRYPPLLTANERLIAGVSGAASLTLLILGLLWPGLIALLPSLLAGVVQQRRERRIRRAALEELERDLPTMETDERERAAGAFIERFPSSRAKRRIHRRLTELDGGEASHAV